MYCRSCNKSFSSDHKFCSECGRPLEDELNIYGVQLCYGDQQAFQKIYNMTYRWVEREIIRKGILKADVEDCMQEFYIHVYQKIQNFDPERGVFRPWFNVLLKNKLEDYSRKSRRLTERELYFYENDDDEDSYSDQFEQMESTDFIPEEEIDQQETRRLLYEILDQLTDAQKQCVLMQYEQQMKVREIAEALGLPEGTVKSATSCGKKKIKEYVLALEKQGTKLYGMAPIPFFLWLLSKVDFEAGASDRVWSAVSHQISGMQSAAAHAGGGVVKEAAVGSKVSTGGSAASKIAATVASGTVKATVTKAIVGVVIVATVAGAGGGAYVYYRNSHRSVQEEQVAEEPAKEENSEETVSQKDIYQLYYEKIQDLEQKYGEVDIAEDEDLAIEYYTGVCYADLTDFDQDGEDELLVAYYPGKNTDTEDWKSINYNVEIWDAKDSELTEIYSGDGYVMDESDYSAYLIRRKIDGIQYMVSGETFGDQEQKVTSYCYDTQKKQYTENEKVDSFWSVDGQGRRIYTVNENEVSEEEYQNRYSEWVRWGDTIFLAGFQYENEITEEYGYQNPRDVLEATKQTLYDKVGIENPANSAVASENQDAKEAFSNLLRGTSYVQDWGSTTSSDLSFQYIELTSEKIPVLLVRSDVASHHDMERIYQYVGGEVRLIANTQEVDKIYLESGMISTFDNGGGGAVEAFYKFSGKDMEGANIRQMEASDEVDENGDWDVEASIDTVKQQAEEFAAGQSGMEAKHVENTKENRDKYLK